MDQIPIMIYMIIQGLLVQNYQSVKISNILNAKKMPLHAFSDIFYVNVNTPRNKFLVNTF